MLKKLTDWLRELFLSVWEAFVQFLHDMLLYWLEHQLSMVLWMIQNIPSPEFLSQHTLGSLLGSAGPTVAWFIVVFKVGESSVLIGTAMVFYILRRILTIGIW